MRYTSVVLVSSEFTLFREREDASLHPSVYRILIIDCVAVSEQYVVELSGLLYFWENLVQPRSFPILNLSKNWVVLFLSERSWFSVQLLTNNSGDWFMCNFRWVSQYIFEILFPHFYSFLLVCSFQFSFGCALPSTHFVYSLPGYARLPIFLWVSNLIYLILYVFSLFF